MYEITQLKNGARIISAHLPHMASVCMGVWAGTGSRHESLAQNGVSHFIEHVLFKGTKTRNAKEISEAVEGVGGYLNAFTAEENTCYYAKASADRFATLVDVLMDMYLNPAFDPDEFEKEREVIKEELAMYMDQPSQLVLEVLNEVLWPDHPLGRCITGTEASLDTLKVSTLNRFWRNHYTSPNTIIVVAGPIPHQKIVAKLRKHARHLPTASPRGYKPMRDHQTQPQIKIRSQHSEQVQLAFGIKTCSRHGENRYALRMLNTMLGENMSSRLFQRLREDHGLAYSVYSNLGFFHDAGFLTIAAGIDRSHVEQALTLIHQTLNEFKETKPNRKELRQTRDYLIGQLDLHLENTENHMIWLGEQILGYGHYVPVETIRNRLAKTTPEDIRTTAREYFQPQNLNLAVVGKVSKKRFSSVSQWLS